MADGITSALHKSGGRQRIAVVGSGIAGLSAAWLLSKHHDVTLYEKETRSGGHSNTVHVPTPHGEIGIDTGFIVYNELNYPNLTALFDHINAPTQASDMSFAVSLDGGRAEYSSVDFAGFVDQGRNLLRPRFWSMMTDLLRFYRRAPSEMPSEEDAHITLGDYLDAKGYGQAFQREHILPQAAAIWSATLEDIRSYPACAFIRFFDNHGLFRFKGRPKWRTVSGGSRSYVDLLMGEIGEARLGCGAAKIIRERDRVCIEDTRGETHWYDQVVIAAHADYALAMLGDSTPDEKRLLGAFRYSANRAVLHTDSSMMPRRKHIWASWNYTSARGQDLQCGVTYWMNNLQKLPGATQYFLSLNPDREIADKHLVWRSEYDHPIFDPRSIAAQQDLWRLQGVNRTWYCGSYFGAGFHEDALQAGLAAAEGAGNVRRPWSVPDESGRIVLAPNQLEAV
jgi:predicted NAD/FAD-binding protein